MRQIRSRSKGTTFQDIPNEKNINDLLKIEKENYDLRVLRTEKVRQRRQLGKDIYNMSMEMNKKQEDIDKIIVRFMQK